MPERAAAATALGKLHDARAVAPLITELPNLTRTARRAALDALKTLTGQDLGDDPAAWQRLGK